MMINNIKKDYKIFVLVIGFFLNELKTLENVGQSRESVLVF